MSSDRNRQGSNLDPAAFSPEPSQDAANTLPPGYMLGSFRILQHIGSGGMGQVYRATDSRLNREVAIKILPRVFARDPDLLSRFQAEARAASALNHPNIVAIYDVGREADLSWIVSELIDGRSLRSVLDAGPLKPRQVVEIGSQIAEGLAAAHAAGLIHRDLKPENIMITRENRVKVLDFGLAKSSLPSDHGFGNTTITQVGTVLGTPGYMSPEQVAGGSIDQRSDIFSLGVILYEMLTHKRPFTGENRVAVMQATLTEDPAPIPQTLPIELIRITERCLEKQPQRRLQSVADVAFSLQMALGSSSQALIAQLPERRFWLRRFGLAAICLLAALAFFWTGYRVRPANASLGGTMRRLTWDDALTTDGAISPDGGLAAYASDRGNGRDLNIYVQQVDGSGTVRVTDDEEANDEPTFSPDGSRIAFESRRGTGGVYEVPAIGGDRRLIAPGGRHPRYSPDGKFILFAKVGTEASLYGGWGAQLYVQPMSGGAPVLLTKDCTHVVAEAVWSPDSKNVLATATCHDKLDVWLISRDGRTLKPTNGSEFWNKHGLNLPAGLTFQTLDQWVASPSRILLSLAEGDTEYSATIPISDDGLRFLDPVNRVDFGPVTTGHASMSTNGRMALTSLERLSNLWGLPIDADGHNAGNPIQLTKSRAFLIQPSLSRDGKLAAFVLTQTGHDQLQVLNLGNPTATPATIQTGWIRHPSFSPDGTKVNYETVSTSFEISTRGGASEMIFPNQDGYVSDWSTDGKRFLWIGRTPDQPAIAVVDRATSRQVFVLSAPGFNLYQAHFSPNQEYVIFNAQQNQHSRIYAAPLRTASVQQSDWIPLTNGTTWDDKPRPSADGKRLFFISDDDGFPCIWVEKLTADMHPQGKPEAVFHSHSFRRSIAGAGLGDMELNVSNSMLVFTLGDTLGNIWIFDPAQTTKLGQ